MSAAQGWKPPSAAATETCLLFTPEAQSTPSSTCANCHANIGAGNHKVDVDYASVASPDRWLRSLQEVNARGIFLKDGSITCMTCHDGSSPWKYRLVLPPGTTAHRTFNPKLPDMVDKTPPQPGDAVDQRPLCLSCHAFD